MVLCDKVFVTWGSVWPCMNCEIIWQNSVAIQGLIYISKCMKMSKHYRLIGFNDWYVILSSPARWRVHTWPNYCTNKRDVGVTCSLSADEDKALQTIQYKKSHKPKINHRSHSLLLTSYENLAWVCPCFYEAYEMGTLACSCSVTEP